MILFLWNNKTKILILIESDDGWVKELCSMINISLGNGNINRALIEYFLSIID